MSILFKIWQFDIIFIWHLIDSQLLVFKISEQIIFRLNLKTAKSVLFSTPTYTKLVFWALISNVYLNSYAIFNASCDLYQTKYLIKTNITSKQTNKQTEEKEMKTNITSKQTNKQSEKKEINSKLKRDAAVPHYYCHNLIYSVSILECNLTSFF